MGAMLNGMAAHGGVVPLGVTYLVFSDYMRPTLRLAAMMGLPVPFVFSHDSIGIGRMAQRTSPSNTWLRYGRSPTCSCSAPPTRSKPPSAGRLRSTAAQARVR